MNVLRKLVLVSGCLCASAHARPAHDDLAAALSALMQPAGAYHAYGDWRSIESARAIRWQALPAAMLDEALPDGSYFVRHGTATFDGRPIDVSATGARTMVTNAYFHNRGAAIGEAALLDALRRRGFALELVRCPLRDARGAGDRWWAMTAPGRQPALLHLRTTCDGAPCEAFALLLGDRWPTLTPRDQLRYTDRCAGADAGAPMPARAAWDEQLASMFAGLIAASGVAPPAWSALDALAAVRWASALNTVKPQPGTDRYVRSGEADLGGRVLYVNATGNATNVLALRAEDQATQDDRGDAIEALRRKGYAVELARCDRVYQLSRGHWYLIGSKAARTVALHRSTRCDTAGCPKGQESYLLALDGVMPPLAPGEVDAVGGLCPGR